MENTKLRRNQNLGKQLQNSEIKRKSKIKKLKKTIIIITIMIRTV